MGEQLTNDVFVSYRRDVGGAWAMALHQELASHGVDAFYDIESIRAGKFGSIILNQIGARPYFLLILTPGTLNRCVEPTDWVRREIEEAIATSRVIIPLHTTAFDFDDLVSFLPGGVGEAVGRFNAQELSQRYFKVAVERLVQEFLLPVSTATVALEGPEQAVLDAMQRAAAATPAVTAVHLSAQEYFERGVARHATDPDGAIADFSEAIRLNPEAPVSFYNRGTVRKSRGDLDGAISDYSQALLLNPLDTSTLLNRASAFAQKGAVELAMADYDRAVDTDPAVFEARLGRGNSRREQGDVAGAIADLDEAVELRPRSAIAFRCRGAARVSAGDVRGGFSDYGQALFLDPQDASTLRERGDARFDVDDVDGAIFDYDEAIRIHPDFVDALKGRSKARSAKRDFDGAIKDLDEAYDSNPTMLLSSSRVGLLDTSHETSRVRSSTSANQYVSCPRLPASTGCEAERSWNWAISLTPSATLMRPFGSNPTQPTPFTSGGSPDATAAIPLGPLATSSVARSSRPTIPTSGTDCGSSRSAVGGGRAVDVSRLPPVTNARLPVSCRSIVLGQVRAGAPTCRCRRARPCW